MSSATRAHIESIFTAAVGSGRQAREQHRTLLSTYWDDFQYCALPVDGHQQLTETTPLHDPTRYNRMCGQCAVDRSELMFGFAYKGDPARGKPDLDARRAAWVAADEVLRQEKRAAEVRRNERAGEIPRAVRLAEREAFLQYLVLAYEYVRDAVIDGYVKHATTESNKDYLAFLRQFELDSRSRRSQKGSDITRTWCATHGKMGHLFPMLGAKSYNTECWTCPRELPREDDGRGLELHGSERDTDVDAVLGIVCAKPGRAAAASASSSSSSSFSLTASASSF
jgi:hypothetical protein